MAPGRARPGPSAEDEGVGPEPRSTPSSPLPAGACTVGAGGRKARSGSLSSAVGHSSAVGRSGGGGGGRLDKSDSVRVVLQR